VAVVIAIDVAIFQTQCLTKLEGISPNVEATLAPHFTNPMNLLGLAVSYSRLHLALILLLLGSLPLLLREGKAEALALLVVFVLGVISTNLLVTGESLRYQYWLLPILLLVAAYGIRTVGAALARAGSSPSGLELGRRWVAPLASILAVGTVVLSFSPWRIPGSYNATVVGDSASAFDYVRTHLRPGDKVAATEPHAHASLVEIGQSDYDLAAPLLFDFVYRKKGRLVDRNAGAQVVSTPEELRDVLARNDRLWVLVNREKFRSRGQDIRWEYPAGRFEFFLRQNLEVKFQSYLWTVFLWDAHAGKFHSLPAALPVSWTDAQ
jgi:hypothetical protein